MDLSDKNSENKIAFQVSKEDSKIIEGTEKVDVKIDNGKTSITDLKIESTKVNSENPEMTDITISLPVGQGKIGEYGEIIIHGRSI